MNTSHQNIPATTPLPVLRKTVLLPANKSEVARLMEQIDSEYESAMRVMGGFASGTARHKFINARMENMAIHLEKLEEQFGEETTIEALVEWSEGVANTAKEGPLATNDQKS